MATVPKDPGAKPTGTRDDHGPGAGAGAGAGAFDDEDEWRHAPVAPKDENPLESLGRSVSEVVTGPLKGEPHETTKKPARP
ncbi:MAG: hypothetical protein ABJA61_00530 [Caldimonas sp.]